MNFAMSVWSNQPVLMDRYMIGVEVEVDAICDGETTVIPGIMEHIERNSNDQLFDTGYSCIDHAFYLEL